MSSSILKQIEEVKQAMKANAEWSDLICGKEIAEKIGRSLKRTNELLKENNITHKGKIGSTYLYSKSEVLNMIKVNN